jgi:formamidopyrimidine-DNA glycosylase
MPEGHTVHRHARLHRSVFGGRAVAVDSPQGRFAAGAARLDGRTLVATQAHGKHLFLGFADEPYLRPDAWLHVHLGLIGGWTFGSGGAPAPRGAVRVRLVADSDWAQLRGPTVCEVITPDEVAAIRARLGADPLRRDADPARAGERVHRSRVPIGALLMQQEVVAGIGNVYRAEALFRQRLDPWTPGRSVDVTAWDALWSDLVRLLRDGLRRGRIVTTLPADRQRRAGAVRAQDAHYVYRRTDLPCRICGTPVVAEPMAGRTLYRCPRCQAAG